MIRCAGFVLAAMLSWAVGEPGLRASELRFSERAEALGLSFQHHHGGSGRRYMVETMVGGVLVFDYDGDGDDDVLWIDGGELPGYEGAPARTVLHRNDAGTFVDVTERSGLVFSGYGCGGAAGDVDGDGDVDVLITAFGQNRLFMNQGNGRFRDETESRGLVDASSAELWSSSAAFADGDGDGDLDLYVGSYVDYTIATNKQCGKPEDGVIGYCHPDVYLGLRDRYYRNQNGRFEEVGEAVGLADAKEATLGVIFADIDGDQWPDIYLANDLDPNQLFRNRGDGTFEDISLLSGTGYSLSGQPEAGMGVDLADLDGNGLQDLVVTNFALESNALYKAQGAGIFVDARFPARIAEPSLQKLGFGLNAADFDHDGDQDLFVANGHILDNAEVLSAVKTYAQPNQLMRNQGGVFAEAESVGLDVVRVSRGSALSDLDLDGDLEVLVVNSNQRSEVYENQLNDERWLQVEFRPASAVGVTAVLRSKRSDKARSQHRVHKTGGSYLAQNSTRLHFGLGDETPVSLLVQWPPAFNATIRLEGLPSGKRLVFGSPAALAP